VEITIIAFREHQCKTRSSGCCDTSLARLRMARIAGRDPTVASIVVAWSKNPDSCSARVWAFRTNHRGIHIFAWCAPTSGLRILARIAYRRRWDGAGGLGRSGLVVGFSRRTSRSSRRPSYPLAATCGRA
jgi:hypothetical protein